jgi:hypothetical protein
MEPQKGDEKGYQLKIILVKEWKGSAYLQIPSSLLKMNRRIIKSVTLIPVVCHFV